MGVFAKAVNFTVAFFSIALTMEAAGISLFSSQLFTTFGAGFFFLAFLNEIALIYL